MSKIIKFSESLSITSSENASILDSCLAAGLAVRYSCQDGRCGECAVQLINGEVVELSAQIALNNAAVGTILTCCTVPKTDIEIECKFDSDAKLHDIKIIPCKIDNYQYIGDEIAIIFLKIPPSTLFDYNHGQYIDLIIKGKKRSYSIANDYSKDGVIELNIRKVPNGLFSGELFDNIQSLKMMRFEGPKGGFYVRALDSPLIFLAGGTGFAPIKSMIGALLNSGEELPEIAIFWGCDNTDLFYAQSEIESWLAKENNLTMTKVVSGQVDDWDGEVGFVHEAVLRKYPSLCDYTVYAAGSPIMLDAAKEDFVKHGLLPQNFYADSFLAAIDK